MGTNQPVSSLSGDRAPEVSPGQPRRRMVLSMLLHIEGFSQPLLVRPRHRRQTLGRWHFSHPGSPDIDLNPYDAYEQGVSQVHAAIQFKNNLVAIVDLGSTNGTWLNGERLPPGQPVQLHGGDEICLCKLRIRVQLQLDARTTQTARFTPSTPA